MTFIKSQDIEEAGHCQNYAFIFKTGWIITAKKAGAGTWK
jgi:hypothetical protein